MTSETTARQALVVGGGIGGLAAGIALRRAGWRVQMFERASQIREVGAGLSLWANAVHALNRLGVGEAVRALNPNIAAGGIYTWRGQQLVLESAAALEQRVGQPSIVLHRTELLHMLRSAFDGELQLGRACVGITQDAERVTAHFADGSSATGDLLIGADGIRSAVRSQLVGDGEPSYAGYTSYRGVTTFDHSTVRFGEYWGRGLRFGIAPLSAGRVYWFVARNAPAGGRASQEEEKAWLLETFREWAEPIGAVIAATPADVILRHDLADRNPIQRWSYGRATLLGDAAHPMTPNLGQGACQALEDAVVLADALAENASIETALHEYEQRRIPRTSAIVRQSRTIGLVGQWHNPLAVSLRDLALRGLGPVQQRTLDQVVGFRV